MADIIYEDDAILAVKKPAGVESQRGRSFAMDLESDLKNELARRHPGRVPYLGVVHRLDRPVAGVMVYAKTKEAAAGLSRQFADKTACKVYEALLPGRLHPDEGRLQDWIETDPAGNRTRIVQGKVSSGCREAILDYRMIPLEESLAFTAEGETDIRLSICGRQAGIWMGADQSRIHAVRIALLTGRHHQIRVQLAHAGTPVLGDTRYGAPAEGLQMRGAIALCAVKLSFRHPISGKKMEFTVRDR